MRVLIVEDDTHVAESLQDSLARTYLVDLAFSGEKGLCLAKANDYGVIILDIGLPDISGVEVCRRLRLSGIKTPILMLTGLDGVTDKVQALDSGADDYLTKPCSYAELMARMRALARRSAKPLVEEKVELDDLVLDCTSREVTRGGKKILLRRKEFDLLEYLLRNKGRVVRRDMIIQQVWDSRHEPYDNTVDVHIKHLRDKIDRPFDRKLIQTVRGIGYKIGL